MSSSYTLTNTAADIDSAIDRVVGADVDLSSVSTNSDNIATSGAIKTYVDGEVETKKLSTGYDVLSSSSGTVSTDGFLILKVSDAATFFSSTTVTVNVGSAQFRQRLTGSAIGHMCIPIAAGESYSIAVSNTANASVTVTRFFKAFGS